MKVVNILFRGVIAGLICLMICFNVNAEASASETADPDVFKCEGIYYWTYRQGEVAVVNPKAIVGNEDVYEGVVVIPSTVPDGRSLKVTAIAAKAFEEYEVTAVTIPATIVSVGQDAFARCGSLEKVQIEDLASWCDMEFKNSYSNPLFFARHLYDANGEIEHLVIPDCVKSFGEYTFKKCLSFKTVDMGNGVREIPQNAFYGCDNVTSVTIPDNVTSMCDGAFWMCASLSDVNGCNGLKQVGRRPFEYTPWEDSLSDGLNYLGANVAYWYKGTPATSIVAVKDGTQCIAADAFYNCKGIKEIKIPSTVSWIGAYAFHECSDLQKFDLTHVSTVGNNMFFRCTALKSVSIGERLEEIPTSMFAGCTSLKTVAIPASVSCIGESAFRECASLRTVTIGTGVTEIGNAAFTGCVALRKIEIPDNVRFIENSAFAGCTNLASVKVGIGVDRIGYGAFYDCQSLSEVIIADSERPLSLSFNSKPYGNPIGSGLFTSGSLIEVYMGRNLVYDDDAECGISPFYSQPLLEKVVLGEKVTDVQSTLFSGCRGLYDVEVRATLPPIVEQGQIFPFEDEAFNHARLKVPAMSVEDYSNAYCWNKFKTILAGLSSTDEVGLSDVNDIGYSLNGRHLKCVQKLSVFSTDGRLLALNVNEFDFDKGGIYIIMGNGRCRKLAVE